MGIFHAPMVAILLTGQINLTIFEDLPKTIYAKLI